MLSLCNKVIQPCLQCFNAKAIVNLQGIRPKLKDVWWRMLANSLQVQLRKNKDCAQ